MMGLVLLWNWRAIKAGWQRGRELHRIRESMRRDCSPQFVGVWIDRSYMEIYR